jgi:hypothetical protein
MWRTQFGKLKRYRFGNVSWETEAISVRAESYFAGTAASRIFKIEAISADFSTLRGPANCRIGWVVLPSNLR